MPNGSIHDKEIVVPLHEIPLLRLANATSHFYSDMVQTGILPPVRRLAHSKATELASFYQQSYRRFCIDLMKFPRTRSDTSPTHIIQSLRLTFEKMYEHGNLPQILREALKAQTTHHKLEGSGTCSTKERRPFKHVLFPPFHPFVV
jgi:hypothetical protein